MTGAAGPQNDDTDAVALASGDAIRVRVLTDIDDNEIRSFFDRVTPASIYRRFFTPLPPEIAAQWEHVSTTDESRHLTLAAEIDGDIVGIARYDRCAPHEAEVAFIVDDAHQGHGIGTLLLERLAASASDHDIRFLSADTLPTKGRMLHVFEHAARPVERHFVDGVVHVRFPIDARPSDGRIKPRVRARIECRRSSC
jgi:GNAT superfamily N-acetyltransferase